MEGISRQTVGPQRSEPAANQVPSTTQNKEPLITGDKVRDKIDQTIEKLSDLNHKHINPLVQPETPQNNVNVTPVQEKTEDPNPPTQEPQQIEAPVQNQEQQTEIVVPAPVRQEIRRNPADTQKRKDEIKRTLESLTDQYSPTEAETLKGYLYRTKSQAENPSVDFSKKSVDRMSQSLEESGHLSKFRTPDLAKQQVMEIGREGIHLNNAMIKLENRTKQKEAVEKVLGELNYEKNRANVNKITGSLSGTDKELPDELLQNRRTYEEWDKVISHEDALLKEAVSKNLLTQDEADRYIQLREIQKDSLSSTDKDGNVRSTTTLVNPNSLGAYRTLNNVDDSGNPLNAGGSLFSKAQQVIDNVKEGQLQSSIESLRRITQEENVDANHIELLLRRLQSHEAPEMAQSEAQEAYEYLTNTSIPQARSSVEEARQKLNSIEKKLDLASNPNIRQELEEELNRLNNENNQEEVAAGEKENPQSPEVAALNEKIDRLEQIIEESKNREEASKKRRNKLIAFAVGAAVGVGATIAGVSLAGPLLLAGIGNFVAGKIANRNLNYLRNTTELSEEDRQKSIAKWERVNNIVSFVGTSLLGAATGSIAVSLFNWANGAFSGGASTTAEAAQGTSSASNMTPGELNAANVGGAEAISGPTTGTLNVPGSAWNGTNIGHLGPNEMLPGGLNNPSNFYGGLDGMSGFRFDQGMKATGISLENLFSGSDGAVGANAHRVLNAMKANTSLSFADAFQLVMGTPLP